MSKKSSVIVLAIVAVLILAIAFFALYPVTLEYGEYNEYYSPLKLIQTSGLYNDSVNGTYTLKLDEDQTAKTVVKQIKQRLTDAYGYYGSNVSVKDDVVSIVVPTTANHELATAETILSNVTANGNIEVFSSSSSSSSSNITYNASNVVLKAEHFKSSTYRRYTNSNKTYCILEIKLNEAGQKAASTLSTSTTYYVAQDETFIYLGCWKVSNSSVQIQVGELNQATEARAKLLNSYINTGALVGELSQEDVVTNSGIGGVILLCGIIAVLVAGWIVLLVKFNTLGIAGIYSQLIAIVAFVIVAGLIGFNLFNTAAVVGLLCGIALMDVFTIRMFAAIKGYFDSKTFASACYKGYADTNKLNLIVHGVVVVLSVVLWLIPTAVTAPLGNALLYMSVLSFIATMGLNRLFVKVLEPFVEKNAK